MDTENTQFEAFAIAALSGEPVTNDDAIVVTTETVAE